MYDTDFELYGQHCNLIEPYRGYCTGTIVGQCGLRFVIRLASGYELALYRDEFVIL